MGWRAWILQTRRFFNKYLLGIFLIFFETAILYNNRLWRTKTAVDVYVQTEETALLLSIKNKLDDCPSKTQKINTYSNVWNLSKVGDNDNRMSLLLLVFFILCAVKTFASFKNCQQTNTCSKVYKKTCWISLLNWHCSTIFLVSYEHINKNTQ